MSFSSNFQGNSHFNSHGQSANLTNQTETNRQAIPPAKSFGLENSHPNVFPYNQSSGYTQKQSYRNLKPFSVKLSQNTQLPANAGVDQIKNFLNQRTSVETKKQELASNSNQSFNFPFKKIGNSAQNHFSQNPINNRRSHGILNSSQNSMNFQVQAPQRQSTDNSNIDLQKGLNELSLNQAAYENNKLKRDEEAKTQLNNPFHSPFADCISDQTLEGPSHMHDTFMKKISDNNFGNYKSRQSDIFNHSHDSNTPSQFLPFITEQKALPNQNVCGQPPMNDDYEKLFQRIGFPVYRDPIVESLNFSTQQVSTQDQHQNGKQSPNPPELKRKSKPFQRKMFNADQEQIQPFQFSVQSSIQPEDSELNYDESENEDIDYLDNLEATRLLQRLSVDEFTKVKQSAQNLNEMFSLAQQNQAQDDQLERSDTFINIQLERIKSKQTGPRENKDKQKIIPHKKELKSVQPMKRVFSNVSNSPKQVKENQVQIRPLIGRTQRAFHEDEFKPVGCISLQTLDSQESNQKCYVDYYVYDDADLMIPTEQVFVNGQLVDKDYIQEVMRDCDSDSDDELIFVHQNYCLNECKLVLQHYSSLSPDLLYPLLSNASISERLRYPQMYDECGYLKEHFVNYLEDVCEGDFQGYIGDSDCENYQFETIQEDQREYDEDFEQDQNSQIDHQYAEMTPCFGLPQQQDYRNNDETMNSQPSQNQEQMIYQPSSN
eukprot:403361123